MTRQLEVFTTWPSHKRRDRNRRSRRLAQARQRRRTRRRQGTQPRRSYLQ